MERAKVLQILGLLTISVAFVSAIIFDRPCPTDVQVVDDFRLDRYLGKWYELERYDQDWSTNVDCVQAQYGPMIDEISVSVKNSAYNLYTETTRSGIRTATLSFPDEEILQGKLNVSSSKRPNDRSNYWILDTDYENYAIVWECEPLPEDASREIYFLLSRTRQLTDDEQINDKVNHLIGKYIESDKVRITNQLDERCPDF